MRKLIVGTLLIAILMSGCSNTMADIYDNESKITSDTNSFNLNGIKQEINGNSYNATVEKIGRHGYDMDNGCRRRNNCRY